MSLDLVATTPSTPAPVLAMAAAADAEAQVSSTVPGGEAAALSFSLADLMRQDHAGGAQASALGFADIGHFTATALKEFFAEAQHAIAEIVHGAERLLGSDTGHDGPVTTHTQTLDQHSGGHATSHGQASVTDHHGSVTATAEGHAHVSGGHGVDSLGLSLSVTEAALPGHHGEAGSSSLSVTETGNFAQGAYEKFMHVAEHAVDEIKGALDHLLHGSPDHHGPQDGAHATPGAPLPPVIVHDQTPPGAETFGHMQHGQGDPSMTTSAHPTAHNLSHDISHDMPPTLSLPTDHSHDGASHFWAHA